MLMRNTSAPAVNSAAIAARSEDAGPRVATILVRRCRLIAPGFRLGAATGATGCQAPRELACRAGSAGGPPLRRLRQLHRPGLLIPGVDFEKAGPLIAASETISRAADREFLVARAHEGLARPLAAAIIVDRIDIIKSRREISAQQRLAIAGSKVPPAFRRPSLAVFVAERDADSALGEVANAEIGGGWRRHQRRHSCKPEAQQARAQGSGQTSPAQDRAQVVRNGGPALHLRAAPYLRYLRFAPSPETRAVPGHVAPFLLLKRVNEYRAEIVDVGISRPGLQQVAQAFEKPGGIILGKKRGRVEAELARPRQRGVVDESAGRIVRLPQ